MIYLDDRIEVTFTGNSVSSLTEGMYYWELSECDIYGGSTTTIFRGNYFHKAGSTKDTFDITDIVRSRKRTMDIEKVADNPEAERSGNVYSAPSHTVMSYYLCVKDSGGNILFSKWITVAMVYRYPNVRRGITDGSNIFNLVDRIEEDDDPNYWYEIAIPLQGNKNTQTSTSDGMYLIPHYPLKQTDQFHIAQTVILGDAVTSFSVNLKQSGSSISFGVKVPTDCFCFTFAVKPSEMFDWNTYHPNMTKDMSLYLLYQKQDGNNGSVQCRKPICVLDACHKRYYLMWEDRLGGMQSQAFNNTIQYSEDYDNIESVNYANDRRKITIGVQPKWKLSSGWIPEDVYCIYESIFTSPYVKLYDSQEDVLYSVIPVGNFTEKNYKNEKKLLNLTIDLERSDKQNILY